MAQPNQQFLAIEEYLRQEQIDRRVIMSDMSEYSV